MKHHFLPVFYLKQWATGPSRKIVEFSKPYRNVVKPKRVHPDGTGYIHRLYASEGVPAEVACEMETMFLSPVDSKAAEALRAMLNGDHISLLQREAWSIFLASLMCRMPEDVRLSKEMLTELTRSMSPSFRRFYEASKPSDQPSTFDELTAEFEASAPNRALRRLQTMISHPKLVGGLSAMHWELLTLKGRRQLLTSDRPVTYTNVLGDAESHLVVAVGPNQLFAATHTKEFMRRLKSGPADQLVTAANTVAVGQADRYVFGADDSQLRFVQNRMGQNKTPQLVERMLGLQRQRIPAVLAAISRLPLDIEP